MSSMPGTAEDTWKHYAAKIAPWYDWGASGPAHSSAFSKIREDQYKWPEFKEKVEEYMQLGATRDQAEQTAEFHMLKKLGRI